MKKTLYIILASIFLFSCRETETTSNSGDLDFQSISHKIIEQANLQPGERVLLVVKPGRFDSLALELKSRLEEAGAIRFCQFGGVFLKSIAFLYLICTSSKIKIHN
jgi:hypothetical protein